MGEESSGLEGTTVVFRIERGGEGALRALRRVGAGAPAATDPDLGSTLGRADRRAAFHVVGSRVGLLVKLAPELFQPDLRRLG